MFCHANPATQHDYKRRACANAHQFFVSEPSLSARISESVCKTAKGSARQRRLLSSAAASVGMLQLFILRSRCDLPWTLQHFSKRVFLKDKYLKELHERQAYFLNGSLLCVSGCGRFLASSDGHDRCVSCFGFWPRSSSSVSHQQRANSAHGHGDLRITVRASPSSASPRASHSSSAIWCSRMSLRGSRTGRGPASRSVHQQMTGCRWLHRRVS